MSVAAFSRDSFTPIHSRTASVAGYALGFALGLTSATQLRIPGLAVGAGEVLLALWLLAFVAPFAFGRAVPRTRSLQFFAGFWFMALATLSFGWVFGVSQNVNGAGNGRDFTAYFLSAILTLVLLSVESRAAVFAGAVRGLLSTVVIPLAVLGILALSGHSNVGPISIMYGPRFTGWALNPNQIALLCAPLPFLAWQVGTSQTGHERGYYIGLSLLCVIIGLATLSDALMLAWLVGGGLLTGLLWISALVRTNHGLLARWIAVFAVPLFLAAGLLVEGPALVRFAEKSAVSDYRAGGQGSDRVARWKNGLQAAAASPIVGLGPGSFSGPVAPLSNEEAHNTAVDWLASTGAIGLSLLVALAAWSLRRLVVSFNPLTFACGVGVALFTMFHFVLRQPVFWFYLLVLTHRPHEELR